MTGEPARSSGSWLVILSFAFFGLVGLKDASLGLIDSNLPQALKGFGYVLLSSTGLFSVRRIRAPDIHTSTPVWLQALFVAALGLIAASMWLGRSG